MYVFPDEFERTKQLFSNSVVLSYVYFGVVALGSVGDCEQIYLLRVKLLLLRAPAWSNVVHTILRCGV